MNQEKIFKFWKISIIVAFIIFVLDMIFKAYHITYFPEPAPFSILSPIIYSFVLMLAFGIICINQLKRKKWAVLGGLAVLGFLSLGSVIKAYDIFWIYSTQTIIESLNVEGLAIFLGVTGYLLFALELGLLLFQRYLYFNKIQVIQQT